MTLIFLNKLQPGESGTIIKVNAERAIRRRLMDMGMIRGTEVEMERVAPLGDPVEVRLRGYHLSLRKAEAAGIQVEVD